MNRKNAINYLQSSGFSEEQITAIEQAFKDEPCADAISRQEAIDAVRAGSLNTATLYGRTEEGETARREIERSIKALPSVSTEKTGRWIEVTDEETLTTRTYHYECSECGTHLKAVEKTRYCSECGALLLVDAKMEVEE